MTKSHVKGETESNRKDWPDSRVFTYRVRAAVVFGSQLAVYLGNKLPKRTEYHHELAIPTRRKANMNRCHVPRWDSTRPRRSGHIDKARLGPDKPAEGNIR
jgi:hypothetical protein